MARYEVAVRAHLRFHTRSHAAPIHQLPEAEQVTILFEGREYVWHPNVEPDDEGELLWPVVSVMVAEADDSALSGRPSSGSSRRCRISTDSLPSRL